MSASGYHILCRNDLRGFNEAAIELITAAMSAGGEGRVSNKGHAIIRAPGGGTMSVSKDPSRNNRGLQNQLADFRRIFGMEPEEALKKDRATDRSIDVAAAQGVPPRRGELLKCKVKGCNRTFAVEGALYSHRKRDHISCRQPGCDFATDHAPAEAAHFRIVHQHIHPRKGTGKKAKEEKAKTTQPQPAPTPQETVRVVTKVVKESEVLKQIRHLLGDDPRLDELKAENKRLQDALSNAENRVAELDAKLKLLKEALEL